MYHYAQLQISLFLFAPFWFLETEPVLELAIVDQAGLELRDPPASASRVLGLKACTTTTVQLVLHFNNH